MINKIIINFLIFIFLIYIFFFSKKKMFLKRNIEKFEYLHRNNFVSLGRPDDNFFE